MANIYDKIISDINDIIGNTETPVMEIVDALENIRDHVEPWIEHLRSEAREPQ